MSCEFRPFVVARFIEPEYDAVTGAMNRATTQVIRNSQTTTHRSLILGLAREGASLARFLADRGDAVTVTDSAPMERLRERVASLGDSQLTTHNSQPIEFALGGDFPRLVDSADTLYVSPGVPETNAVFRAAVQRSIPIRSMTTLFFDLCPGPILGVTGSSGKTTTTGLIGHILTHAGYDAVVGGNMGDPMIDLLPEISATTTVVLELSSFQLSLLDRSPHIAIVTNISPNHLDRHGSMEEYVAAKRHIVQHQRPGDYAILNAADDAAQEFAWITRAHVRWFGESAHATDGAAVRNGVAGLVSDGEFSPVIPVSDIPLLGCHNVENVLAACAAAAILGVATRDMATAVQTFRPPPHRLETVGVHSGVRFIDDSIATTPDRASVALRAIEEPVLLIAGGRDKHLPWERFARLVVQKTRGLFLIGEATDLIQNAVLEALEAGSGLLIRESIHRCDSLNDAVVTAAAAARPGDAVLLSPACTSYDMFQNFEDRGTAFALAVEGLHAE